MKKILLAATAAVVCASSASAATLISAAVTGPTGTVWNTNGSDSFYALFLLQPPAGVMNPNDNFTSYTATEGQNNFVILGEGFPSGVAGNSDPSYNVTLNFADGAQLVGTYTGSTFMGGSSTTVGNTTYTLTGFGWDRSPTNNVSAYRAVSGGDPADYTGQFSFNVSTLAGAVPEPATWAMFVLGFGVMGGAMRTRARRAGAVRKGLVAA